MAPLKLLAPPGAFCTPKYFFPYHRTLIWPTYCTFLQPNNFNSKFWRPLLMAPPATPGQPGLRYANDLAYLLIRELLCLESRTIVFRYNIHCILYGPAEQGGNYCAPAGVSFDQMKIR